MNENIIDALEQISDKHISEAAKRYHRRKLFYSAVAAILVVAIGCSIVWYSQKLQEPTILSTTSTTTAIGTTPTSLTTPTTGTVPITPPSVENPPQLVTLSGLVAEPVYPTDMSQRYELQNSFSQYALSLSDFYTLTMQEFLSGEENQVYSPVNLYMALAMLAETASGSSRQQILDLLGVDSIEALREQADCIWSYHYTNYEYTKLTLGNSLWLDGAYQYNIDTVQTLADRYYASVFSGDLGSEEMNETLRKWINQQTGGLLKEQTQGLKLDPESVFALASTVYFKTSWTTAFFPDLTTDGIFHSPHGDVTVPFMNSSHTNAYYWGEGFTAVRASLEDGNAMWLVLPDEGKTPSDILQSGDFFNSALFQQFPENVAYPMVNLSMPKFDISEKSDLIGGLKELGVTEVFQPGTADLSSLTDANAYVGKVEQGVRVAVDEDGVLGAAYTIIDVPNYGMPPDEEVDFVLDRPFLFVVTGRGGMPLFAGTVAQP